MVVSTVTVAHLANSKPANLALCSTYEWFQVTLSHKYLSDYYFYSFNTDLDIIVDMDSLKQDEADDLLGWLQVVLGHRVSKTKVGS